MKYPDTPGRLLEELERALALEAKGGPEVIGVSDRGGVAFDLGNEHLKAAGPRWRVGRDPETDLYIDQRLAELAGAGFRVPRRMEIVLDAPPSGDQGAVARLRLDTESRRQIWEPMERDIGNACRRGLASDEGPCGPYAVSFDAALEQHTRGATPLYVHKELGDIDRRLLDEDLPPWERKELETRIRELRGRGRAPTAITQALDLDPRFWREVFAVDDIRHALETQKAGPGSKGLLDLYFPDRNAYHVINWVVDGRGQVRLFDRGGRQELHLVELDPHIAQVDGKKVIVPPQIRLVGDRGQPEIPQGLGVDGKPLPPRDVEVATMGFIRTRNVDGSLPPEQRINATRHNLDVLREQPDVVTLSGFPTAQQTFIRQFLAEQLRPSQLQALDRHSVSLHIDANSGDAQPLRRVLRARTDAHYVRFVSGGAYRDKVDNLLVDHAP